MSMRYQAGIVLPGYNPLKVANAPTIGTATGGNASASVTFTAPSDVGGGAISGYSVVSTPGGIIGTGASSPVTVSGLSNGTAYTFKVFATNAYGPSPLSAASNSVTPALAVSYLVIAGAGGGGGEIGGGGGAGGLLTAASFAVASGSPLTVTVGAGGAGGPAATKGAKGTSGSNSVFSSITATGGG